MFTYQIKTRLVFFILWLLIGIITLEVGYLALPLVRKFADHGGCSSLGDTEKLQCWQEAFELTLEKEGIGEAFILFSSLYKTEPLFAFNCHDFNHRIGEAAYHQFARGNEFEVMPETAFCAFGFYHGFMQALVNETEDIEKAREFCSYVDEKLKGKTPNAGSACYHGIGHGFADTHDPTRQGDERAIVAPALKLCEQVAQTDEQLFFCATGVFDSIAYAYYNHLYGLEINKKDPLWFCREQPEKYKKACYMDTMPAILWLGGQTLAKAAPYIGQVEEDVYAKRAIRSLADNSVRFLENKHDYATSILTCRSLQERLHLPCIEGLAEGFTQFGPLNDEYLGGLEFCKTGLLTSQEKSVCFQSVLSYSKELYSREKIKQICMGVEKQYQKLCDFPYKG